MVLRILHPILASTLCAANPLARIAEPHDSLVAMERCLDFAPFAVARFCVPLSFAEPSLCCNVAIALSAARRPRCEQGALARRYQHPRRAMSAVILDRLIDAAGVVCGVSSGR